MSHLSPVYFSSLPASEEGGACCKSTAAEIKTWWRVSEQCMCVEVSVCTFVWKKERKEEGGGYGIKPVSWGLFSMSGRRWGDGVLVLTGQSHSHDMDTHSTHTTHTHRGTRLFFCIIYEMLPLSLVLHLASTECQEKEPCTCGRTQPEVCTHEHVCVCELGTSDEGRGRERKLQPSRKEKAR